MGRDPEPTRLVRVLVVDDSPQLRRGLALLLAAQPDIELVGTATDGREACARAASLQPDVVLMDISMPGVDGVEATREVVTSSPCVRVVVLTSSVDHRLLQGAREAGATSVVSKDVDPDELLDRIRAAAACEEAR